MNKTDLINAIASNANLSKADAGRALAGLMQSIESALKTGENVTLLGFGSFEVKLRAERNGRNPQTGESITIAAAKVPGFKAGKALKDAIQ